MAKQSGTHLDYLDGIRGFSALYVFLDHAYNMLFYANVGQEGGWTYAVMAALRPLAFGRYAVDMFIVLSGYSLTLPLARNNGRLRGGFNGYLQRRARRILPPYYAALGFCLLLIIVRQAWFPTPGAPSAQMDEFPAWGDLVTHVLLVHNLFDRWAHSIDSPMWSVASEWQIYFIFPSLLLPAWRRWNCAMAIALAFGIGYALHLLVPGGLEGAAPWYIGLFAFGMGAAAYTSPPAPVASRPPANTPWGFFCLILLLLLALAGTVMNGWFRTHAWLIDPIFGLAATSLILWCNSAFSLSPNGAKPLLLRVLSSRSAVALGAFSYSLYLVHYPLLELTASIFRHLALPPGQQILFTFGVCVPVIVTLAYLFHLAFERPFMPGRPRSLRQAETAAALSPAP